MHIDCDSIYDARIKARSLGAHYSVLYVEKRCNAWGIEKEIVHDFIEYYFSFDKKEIGYYCVPTKTLFVISREWDESFFKDMRMTVLTDHNIDDTMNTRNRES